MFCFCLGQRPSSGGSNPAPRWVKSHLQELVGEFLLVVHSVTNNRKKWHDCRKHAPTAHDNKEGDCKGEPY